MKHRWFLFENSHLRVGLLHVDDQRGHRALVLHLDALVFWRVEDLLQLRPVLSVGIRVTIRDSLVWTTCVLHVLGHHDLALPVVQATRAGGLDVGEHG